MSEEAKRTLEQIAESTKKLDEVQKSYIAGLADGMAKMKEEKKDVV